MDGQIDAGLSTSVLWSSGKIADGYAISSLSAAPLGPNLAVTVDDVPYLVDDAGNGTALRAFDAWVSETRVWDLEGERFVRAAVCMPLEDEVRWGPVLSEANWSAGLQNALGPVFPDEPRRLYYPMSVDAGPDGRMYVLDAGNARVVSFDADGNYITQWGRKGSDVGEFNFGDGGEIPGLGQLFFGSICVDDEGYIYVADVGNNRIQRFSP